jgi:hypothetical protein
MGIFTTIFESYRALMKINIAVEKEDLNRDPLHSGIHPIKMLRINQRIP